MPIPWPPKIPPRLVKDLAPFTFYRDGVIRWYKGKPLHVCGKRVPLDQILDRWQDRKKQADGKSQEIVRSGSSSSYIAVASEFYGYLDDRVNTGRPEPLSPYTREDYKQYVNAFGASAGADRPMNSFGPADFKTFIKLYDGKSPTQLTHAVSYVRAFFSWCVAEGYLQSLPLFGRYFIKPAKQEHRDQRMTLAKSYDRSKIQMLWDVADDVEKCWICLGLNGAFDNADLANFTDDVIDWKTGLIDYRRRKKGKVRRVIPMLEWTIKYLKAYERPEPASPEFAHLFFLTPTGLPLSRLKDSSNPDRAGRANPIDRVSMVWTRLLIRAGLRAAPVMTREGHGKSRRRRLKFAGDSDRKGYRSFRTGFPNLAPPGYRDEIEIVMGHVQDSVLVENYLETVGVNRLRELVASVWASAFSSPWPRGESSAP